MRCTYSLDVRPTIRERLEKSNPPFPFSRKFLNGILTQSRLTHKLETCNYAHLRKQLINTFFASPV